MNIKGCIFRDAQLTTDIPDLIQENPIIGSAIAGLNATIYVNGDSENVSSTFERADIETLGCNLSVTYANFESSSIGAGESTAGQTVIIEDNSFIGINRPSTVAVIRSMASGEGIHTIVRNNSFEHLSDPFTNVFVIHINGKFNPTDLAIIDYNSMISTNVINYNAIRYTVFNSENTIIENNPIEMNSTDNNTIGIFCILGDTKGSEINYNNIQGDSENFDINDSSTGIRAFVAGGLLYCSNITDKLVTGLSFAGECSDSKVSQNQINNHLYGLIVSDSGNGINGVFGVQNGTRNTWEEDNFEDYIYAAWLSSGLGSSFSRYLLTLPDYEIQTYNPQEYDQEPSLVSPEGTWFIPGADDNDLCN